MSDSMKTPLTVAKLKAFCTLNDLPTSGKKAELIQRLLDSGMSKSELKIEGAEVEIKEEQGEVVESETSEGTAEEEPESFSLEDESTISGPESESPKGEKKEESKAKKVDESEDSDRISLDIDDEILNPVVIDEDTVEDDEILEAEIFDAEIVDSPTEEIKPVENKIQKETPPTLIDILKEPKSIAVLCAILILGGGGYWFLSQSLDPMSVESLNYGDEMRYVITSGAFLATDEFIEPVIDYFDFEEEVCRLELEFSGIGSNSITQGTSSDLASQSSSNKAKLLGAVPARGSYGGEWLTIESVTNYELSNLLAKIHEVSGADSSICSSSFVTANGNADLTLTSWTELTDRATIATHADWDLDLREQVQGVVHSYGAGGILGDLDILGPSVSMITQPIELKELFGNDFIDNDASGSKNGWNWRVLGTDTISGTKMWKIVATQSDLEQYCLGSATLNLWIEPNNPWPTQQVVDVSISGANADRQGCSASTQFLGDRVLPEGELKLSHTFTSTSLTRGSQSLDYGANYDNRPRGNELGPTDDDKLDWTANSSHARDNGDLRQFTLEDAVACIDNLGGNASGARSALQEDGYVYRSTQTDSDGVTIWNVSWIDRDDSSGWVLFNQTGEASQENCTYTTKGPHEDASDWNREGVPEMVEFAYIEDQLTASGKYPGLYGEKGIFTQSGEYHDNVRVGHLIVTPTSAVNELISNFIDTGTGASTMDISREWTDGPYEHRTDVLIELNDGRVLGWNYFRTIP